MLGQPGFFDLWDRYAALSAAGDPLERLSSVVEFEVFPGRWWQSCAGALSARAAGHRVIRK